MLIYCSSGPENTGGEPQVFEYNNFTLPKRQEKLEHLAASGKAAHILMGRHKGEQHGWRAVSLHIAQCHSANLHREGETSCRDYYRPNSSVVRKLLMKAPYRITISCCTLLFPEAERVVPWQHRLPDSSGWTLFLHPWTNLGLTVLLLQLPKYSSQFVCLGLLCKYCLFLMSDSLYRHNFNTRGSTATVWLSPVIIMMFSNQRSEKSQFQL